MTNDQFQKLLEAQTKSFTKYVDDKLDDQLKRTIKYIDNSLAPIKDEITSINVKVDDIYKTLDYLVGETSDIKDELGFHIKQTDETLENHETRIAQLELASH